MPSHPVGCALDKERERRGDVGRLENDGMQLDAVAHGDHDFGALVIVKDVVNGIAGALVNYLGIVC